MLLHLSAQAVAAVPIASVAAAAALAAAASAAAGLPAVLAEVAAAFESAEAGRVEPVAPRDALVRDSVALEPAVATVPP